MCDLLAVYVAIGHRVAIGQLLKGEGRHHVGRHRCLCGKRTVPKGTRAAWSAMQRHVKRLLARRA